MKSSHRSPQFGGITLEYIIITVLTGVVSLASATYLAGLVKERLEKLGTELGHEGDLEGFDASPFEP